MEPSLYATIFYIVGSLAIIILTTGMVYVFKEALPLFRNLRIISEKVRHESTLLIEDVNSIRTSIRKTINALLKLINFTKK